MHSELIVQAREFITICYQELGKSEEEIVGRLDDIQNQIQKTGQSRSHIRRTPTWGKNGLGK